MELPGRCGDWLDTATVTVQGLMLRLDTTSKGWGLLLGHQRGLLDGHLRGLSHGQGQPLQRVEFQGSVDLSPEAMLGFSSLPATGMAPNDR